MQYDPDAVVSEDQARLGPGESAPDDVDLTLHRAVAIREWPRWQAQPPARLLQAQRRSLGSPRSAAEPVARGGGSLPAVTVGWSTGRGRIAGGNPYGAPPDAWAGVGSVPGSGASRRYPQALSGQAMNAPSRFVYFWSR